MCVFMRDTGLYFPLLVKSFLIFILFLIGVKYFKYCDGSGIHQHESTIGMHMSPLFSLPPHPTPLGCHRALSLGLLHHTANSH